MHLSPALTVVRNARVVDPDAETVTEPRDVLIEDGRITAVAPAGSAPDGGAGYDAGVYDAGGRVVLPGLIDAHVHVTASTADLGTLGDTSPFLVAAQAQQLLHGMLARGFTTVRDAAGADHGLAEALRRGLFVGPRLYFGGKALSQTGGHGDPRGPGTHVHDDHACCPHLSVICDGVDAVRRAAREQLRTGADHLKIMLSGGVASPTDRIGSRQFSDDEIRAAVEEAEAFDRYVLGHAYTARAVDRGLRLGVRSIEHGNLIDAGSVALLREHDAFLVPTLVTYERLKAEGAAHGLPEASRQKIDTVLVGGLDALRLATDGGANVVFGTDLLGGMQVHQSAEFRIRAAVVPSPAVLRSATTTAARLLRAEGELGVIAPGAHADLVVCEGDPLADAAVLADPDHTVRAVIRGGRRVLTDGAGAG